MESFLTQKGRIFVDKEGSSCDEDETNLRFTKIYLFQNKKLCRMHLKENKVYHIMLKGG